jgi:hypothetical protein
MQLVLCSTVCALPAGQRLSTKMLNKMLAVNVEEGMLLTAELDEGSK